MATGISAGGKNEGPGKCSTKRGGGRKRGWEEQKRGEKHYLS